MQRSKLLTLTVTAAVVIFFLQALPFKTLAASAPGITISPATSDIDIKSGELAHPINFTIKNNQPSDQTINLSTADFDSLDNTGGLIFVGVNPNRAYGLANWIDLPQKQVVVPAGKELVVTANIINRTDLTPGGHYGALMLGLSSAPTATNNAVALQPIASSLLFIDKLGGDVHKMTLDNVSFDHQLWSLPPSVTLKFINEGNTHVIPRGLVTVNDSSGRTVEQGAINEDSQIILPGKARYIQTSLKGTAFASQPGKYSLNVDYRIDGSDAVRHFRTSLWYVLPLGMIALVFVVGLWLLTFKKIRTKIVHGYKKVIR